MFGGENGASEGIRTLDTHVGNVMLYQAELRSLPSCGQNVTMRGVRGQPFHALPRRDIAMRGLDLAASTGRVLAEVTKTCSDIHRTRRIMRSFGPKAS